MAIVNFIEAKTLVQNEIVWIDSNSKLDEMCSHLQNVSLLALDTEFMRSTTYYPKAGLLQISDGEKNYLIDPLTIDDWFPLNEVLDSDILIAIHSCSEDIEVLQLELGCVPRHIFDTQISAAFLGYDASVGYANLIREVMQISLPKDVTRSDWLQRPLSKPQLFYAALDVEYLFRLACEFRAKLDEINRLAWVLEEGQHVYKNYKRLQNIQNSHQRIKSAWRLSPKKLSVLIALAHWRENLAQQRDLPRNRVMKEKTMMELAVGCPEHPSQLRKYEGLSERFIREDGRDLVELIQDVYAQEENKEAVKLPKPLDKQGRAIQSDLRDYTKIISKSLNIAPEIVLRKKDTEALVRMKMESRWAELESYFVGWRQDAVGSMLIQKLREL